MSDSSPFRGSENVEVTRAGGVTYLRLVGQRSAPNRYGYITQEQGGVYSWTESIFSAAARSMLFKPGGISGSPSSQPLYEINSGGGNVGPFPVFPGAVGPFGQEWLFEGCEDALTNVLVDARYSFTHGVDVIDCQTVSGLHQTLRATLSVLSGACSCLDGIVVPLRLYSGVTIVGGGITGAEPFGLIGYYNDGLVSHPTGCVFTNFEGSFPVGIDFYLGCNPINGRNNYPNSIGSNSSMGTFRGCAAWSAFCTFPYGGGESFGFGSNSGEMTSCSVDPFLLEFRLPLQSNIGNGPSCPAESLLLVTVTV